MQVDPSGSVAEATAPDTTAEPTTAPDTGSTVGDSSAVESPSDEANAPDQPTPDSDDSAEDDGTDEGTEQTEEQRRLSRRERQRLREQERIDQAVNERVAAREREQTETAERQQREAAAQKAREQSAREFAAYIGEEGESDRLGAENAELYDRLRTEIGSLDQEQFDEIDQKIQSNKARLADISRAQGFQEKIGANIWNGIEAHVMSPLAWPELSDPAAKRRYITAEGGIAGALNVLKDVLVSATEARKDAEIDALKKSHATEVSTFREEMRGYRVRAGLEEVPDTTSGGTAAADGLTLTVDRYSRMTSEQRAELRKTPEGRARIDRMTRTGAA